MSSFEESLGQTLASAGVGTYSALCVTGADGFETMLWLANHGYEHAPYVPAGRACPHDGVDAVIIGEICDGAALSHYLARGPRPDEGGLLIFRACAPIAHVEAVVGAWGFILEEGAARDGRLHVARRGALLARAA